MPLAMRPLRDQMAHCRRTAIQPSALTRSPRRSRGLTPCERLVSGSTPNEITSCLRTSRSSCSLDRLRKRDVGLKDAPNKCSSSLKQKHPTDVGCFCFGNRRRRVAIRAYPCLCRSAAQPSPCARSLLYATGKCKPFRCSSFRWNYRIVSHFSVAFS